MTKDRLSVLRRWDVIGWVLRSYNRPSEIRCLLADIQPSTNYSEEILYGLEIGLIRPGHQPPRYGRSDVFPSHDQDGEVSP